ncbi:MAG: hypothetical protein IPG99_07870 [Ignavibacteria bacterium]|nr:hypothetical protein [Ignavibacteria bacterium]
MTSSIIKLVFLLMIFLSIAGSGYAQLSPLSFKTLTSKSSEQNSLRYVQQDDSQKVTPKKTSSQKTNIGGVFLSPTVGVAFPTGKFGELSNSGFYYGFKLEFGFIKLYPFVFGVIYEGQSNGGNAEFTTSNFLTQFDTDITYMGGSVDIILNKYIKSNFTIPVFTLELKYANIKRTLTPDNVVPEIPREDSKFTYSLGLAFTLYVFDVGGKYTFAGDYSNLTFNARIHIPLFKF